MKKFIVKHKLKILVTISVLTLISTIILTSYAYYIFKEKEANTYVATNISLSCLKLSVDNVKTFFEYDMYPIHDYDALNDDKFAKLQINNECDADVNYTLFLYPNSATSVKMVNYIKYASYLDNEIVPNCGNALKNPDNLATNNAGYCTTLRTLGYESSSTCDHGFYKIYGGTIPAGGSNVLRVDIWLDYYEYSDRYGEREKGYTIRDKRNVTSPLDRSSFTGYLLIDSGINSYLKPNGCE